MTNLEPVARAICAACGENPDHQGDPSGNQYRWQDYIDVAQAAIAAMNPLSQEAIVDGFCSQPHDAQFVSVFCTGVRWAERQHGIGGEG